MSFVSRITRDTEIREYPLPEEGEPPVEAEKENNIQDIASEGDELRSPTEVEIVARAGLEDRDLSTVHLSDS